MVRILVGSILATKLDQFHPPSLLQIHITFYTIFERNKSPRQNKEANKIKNKNNL